VTRPNSAVDDNLLEIIGISKRFGDFTANDDITLRVRSGEIHALLGENGAGKSTLVKMIYGALQPDAGELRWCGEPTTVANPAAARRLGIGMVFQHFSLFDALSVAENIALALPGKFDLAALTQRITQVSTEYGLSLEATALVADLSVGERQRVEIVRCLLQEPRLLIMDEPTAVLTPQEAEQLFVTLDRLAANGCAVLYISHRLEEVKRLCHSATVLRHGKVVGNVDPKSQTAASLARLMVGADVHQISSRPVDASGPVLLSVARPQTDRLASPCRASTWPFAPAKSLPSPASPETARASCSIACRVSARALLTNQSASTTSPAADSASPRVDASVRPSCPKSASDMVRFQA
jgi:simple sugar transport system ATP-binding protein